MQRAGDVARFHASPDQPQHLHLPVAERLQGEAGRDACATGPAAKRSSMRLAMASLR
jgi:hypothetical protein